MGSGDPSGLQNQRELVNPALVGSTPTRFRQLLWVPSTPRRQALESLRISPAGSDARKTAQLQNQRELVNPALVGSTPTRFRQLLWVPSTPRRQALESLRISPAGSDARKTAQLQNQRELVTPALVGSTPTRFRQFVSTFTPAGGAPFVFSLDVVPVATIRWDFLQGHADERSAQSWDKIAAL